MIVVTGASGFIGSCLVGQLNQMGLGREVLVVDDFYKDHKEVNLAGKVVREWVHRDIFLKFFSKIASQIEFVFHLGARTDTVEQDKAIFDELNVGYSKSIWKICTEKSIPLIYASSAATYGDGTLGYKDEGLDYIQQLAPLNAYGRSKNDFDIWALQQKDAPPYWVGLKFFNVYGPNEFHKQRMASVIFHAVRQIKKNQVLKLFKSHRKDFEHGEQSRDFIYVKDILKVLIYLKNHRVANGLYNIGTGKARTFNDLGNAVFEAMNCPSNIQYIDTPLDIRDKYQYYTKAENQKLLQSGYTDSFYTLEEGIKDYVQNYLFPSRNYF